jgi:hypothetical protein
MIGCDSGYLSGFLTNNRPRYPDIDAVGMLALPRGRAVKVDGGYRVSGHWPFPAVASIASGSLAAVWCTTVINLDYA